jgi:hypothetical protein
MLDFLDWSCYFLYQVAPQLFSQGSVDPVPDPLLLRKSGSAGNRTRTSGSAARNSDHYTPEVVHVGYEADEMALRQFFYKYSGLSCQFSLLQLIHIN